jgi:hypothetical protein
MSDWSSKSEFNFTDFIAHMTQSSINVKRDKRQILYEKARFHDLKVRESLLKEIICKQKEIQQILTKITEASLSVNNLTNALEVKMKKKDCFEIILAELIFLNDRFKVRVEEADKISSAVSQAQSLAAKKAKMTRISGIKGAAALLYSPGNNNGSTMGLNKHRASRSAGLNRGSQYLDNSRNLSKHAINIASRMNLN